MITFFGWISDNLLTVILSALILAAVAFVIIRLVKNKRAGKSSCSCDCAGCAMRDSCHKR